MSHWAVTASVACYVPLVVVAYEFGDMNVGAVAAGPGLRGCCGAGGAGSSSLVG